MPRPTLRLLGGFDLRVDGIPLEVQPAGQRLLALLALAGAAVERSYTAFQLWPDTSEERAKANLRSTVWRLRQTPAELVTTSKTHIRLESAVWVDLCEGLAESAVRGASDAARWDNALCGELLPDWYDDWLVTERERIRQLRLHDIERCGTQLLDSGRADDAIQLGLRAIALDPLRESAHRLVVRCHLSEGNLVEAVRQYDRFRDLLGRELGAAPSRAMTELIFVAQPAGAALRPHAAVAAG